MFTKMLETHDAFYVYLMYTFTCFRNICNTRSFNKIRIFLSTFRDNDCRFIIQQLPSYENNNKVSPSCPCARTERKFNLSQSSYFFFFVKYEFLLILTSFLYLMRHIQTLNQNQIKAYSKDKGLYFLWTLPLDTQ